MQLRSAIGLGWLAFFAYWWISALSAKKNVRRRSTRWEAGMRILWIAVIIALTQLRATKGFFQGGPPPAEIDSLRGVAGLVICAGGFALAVWARRHLGRNWGMPMSLQAGHELVTSGPYRYVRHPIYTGMLLAILGSALVAGLVWIFIFAGMAIYCVYSARTEEFLMLQQFPEQYPQYRQRTKAIVPFLY